MATEKPTKRKGGGSKLARSEQVSIRLDPKLRLAAELAAAKERRTLSSFIEWATEEAVKRVFIARESTSTPKTAWDVAHQTWDEDAADSLVRLAWWYPELLTHEERKIFKLLREFPIFWAPAKPHEKNFQGFDDFREARPNWAVIRLAWDLIQDYIKTSSSFDGYQGFDWITLKERLQSAGECLQVYHPKALGVSDAS